MSPFDIYKKTFIFTFLKAFAGIFLTYVAYVISRKIYVVVRYILHAPERTPQILEPVFGLSYAIMAIGIATSFCYFINIVIQSYLKALHMIIVTRLCVEDETRESQLGNLGLALKEVFKNVISVHIYFLCDFTIHKSIEDITAFISKKDIPILNKFNIKFITKFLAHNIKLTALYSDEIIFSYLYYRIRIDQEAQLKSSSKKIMKYSVEGIIFYVKSCIFILKDTLIFNLKIQIFKWLTVLIFFITTVGVLHLSMTQITQYGAYSIAVYILVDKLMISSYHLINTIHTFYNVLDRKTGESEEDVSKVGEDVLSELQTASTAFTDLINKAGVKLTDLTYKENIESLKELL